MTALQVAEKSKIKCAGGFAVKAISNIQAITSPEVTLLPSKNNSDFSGKRKSYSVDFVRKANLLSVILLTYFTCRFMDVARRKTTDCRTIYV